MNRATRTYLIGQIVAALAIYTFGAAYAFRSAIAGQWFPALGFAALAYFSGYRLLLRNAIAEYRQYQRRLGVTPKPHTGLRTLWHNIRKTDIIERLIDYCL